MFSKINFYSNSPVFAFLGNNNDGKSHVLIMDEVDGMAGNEDRGGMQASVFSFLFLITHEKIPLLFKIIRH